MERTKIKLDFEKRPIVLYDSECPLCVRFIQSLKRIPGSSSINPICFRNDEVYEKFPQLTKEECDAVMHLVTEDDSILVGEKGVEHLIKLFPLVSKFTWLLESNVGQSAMEMAYKMALKSRDRLLKRCTACKNT